MHDFADETTPPRGEITQARIKISELEAQASRASKLWALITVAACLALSACAHVTWTRGVPDLHAVDAEVGLYRGGEPTEEGWRFLNVCADARG